LQSLAGQFETHNNYIFLTRLEKTFAEKTGTKYSVALAQMERMEELCACRVESGKMLEDAASGCNWLIPQYTPAEYVHAYWSVSVHMVNPNITWYDFRRMFMELGGDTGSNSPVTYGAGRYNCVNSH